MTKFSQFFLFSLLRYALLKHLVIVQVCYTDLISSASPAPIRVASALISESTLTTNTSTLATYNTLTPVATSSLPNSAMSNILSMPVTSNFCVLGHDAPLVKTMLTLLTELMASVQDIHRDLAILSAQVQLSGTEVNDDICEICELPASNMTEFNQFDERLKLDKILFNKLVQHLSKELLLTNKHLHYARFYYTFITTCRYFYVFVMIS